MLPVINRPEPTEVRGSVPRREAVEQETDGMEPEARVDRVVADRVPMALAAAVLPEERTSLVPAVSAAE